MNMRTTLVNILTAHHERPVQCRRSRTDDGYTKTLQNTTACKEETFEQMIVTLRYGKTTDIVKIKALRCNHKYIT